ncbi:MAG: death-on-curing family protein [Microgenomates group bacterium Gr01-1014_16]|nr:MAG: death-on-curing family protein [Microgenomates group bacterium Gr01-1014_16]
MKYLAVEEVVVIHDRYVEQFGGSLGIRDHNLLESAVLRCQGGFRGKDLYKTLFEKAAALLHGILFNHPFVDGNKRTALFSASRFLYINGYELNMTNNEAESFPLFVEETRPQISDISSWFRSHSRPIK